MKSATLEVTPRSTTLEEPVAPITSKVPSVEPVKPATPKVKPVEANAVPTTSRTSGEEEEYFDPSEGPVTEKPAKRTTPEVAPVEAVTPVTPEMVVKSATLEVTPRPTTP